MKKRCNFSWIGLAELRAEFQSLKIRHITHWLQAKKAGNCIQYTGTTPSSTERNRRIRISWYSNWVRSQPDTGANSHLASGGSEEAPRVAASAVAEHRGVHNMFLLSRLDFIMRGAKVAMKPLHKAFNKIKAYVKKWLNLPPRASPELSNEYKPYCRELLG